MKIEFSFSYEDFKAIWSIFRGYTTFSIKNARVLYFAVPTTSLILFLIGKYSGYFWLQTQGSIFSSLVGIPIHIAYDRWKFTNWLKSNFLLDSENESHSLIANDEELVVAKSDSIETRMTWNAITDFRQNEVITVIYLSPDNCIYFPTKAMTVEQRAELNELVARHVVKRKP
jgi:hypothetical protein